MDIQQISLVGLALVFVIGLIWLFGQVGQRFGLGTPMVGRPGNRRLRVVESAALDPKRRLLLVRRDDTEHLLLLGPAGEVVVETGIPMAEAPAPEAQP